jgi:tetratricopeptide (TPR) repeat protein
METMLEEALEYLESDTVKALTLYKKVVEETPEDFRGYVGLARCYSRLKRLDQAVENAEKALELNPVSVKAYHVLTYVAFKRKDKENCFLYAHKAFELNTDSYDSLTNLASSYMVLGNYDKSIEFFQKSLVIKPDDFEIRIKLVEVYLHLKKWKEAQDELRDVIKTDASPYILILWLGSLLHIKYSLLKYPYIAGWIAFMSIYFGALIFEISALYILLIMIFILVIIYVISTRKRNKAVSSVSASTFLLGLILLFSIVFR